MKHISLLAAFLVAGCSTTSDPPIPIASGQHVFQHRFAEHPSIPSVSLTVVIDGSHIVVTNPRAVDPFPAGVLADGKLMWHTASAQWIIGHKDTDRLAQDVGGCSDGPQVVDLAAKIYWTC
jgi:uncharacterized lipoprotein YbaY